MLAHKLLRAERTQNLTCDLRLICVIGITQMTAIVDRASADR